MKQGNEALRGRPPVEGLTLHQIELHADDGKRLFVARIAGIHVGHVVIDGGIRSERRPVPSDKPDSLLDPTAIAESYVHLLRQPRSAWSWEVELRPWVEKF